MSEPMTIRRVAELAKASVATIPECKEIDACALALVCSHDDLLAALERHEWYGTDWSTWRCASCSVEIQDGEELRHDDLCPTAAAIKKAKLPA